MAISKCVHNPTVCAVAQPEPTPAASGQGVTGSQDTHSVRSMIHNMPNWTPVKGCPDINDP